LLPSGNPLQVPPSRSSVIVPRPLPRFNLISLQDSRIARYLASPMPRQTTKARHRHVSTTQRRSHARVNHPKKVTCTCQPPKSRHMHVSTTQIRSHERVNHPNHVTCTCRPPKAHHRHVSTTQTTSHARVDHPNHVSGTCQSSHSPCNTLPGLGFHFVTDCDDL
jgi:hypothetical protein